MTETPQTHILNICNTIVSTDIDASQLLRQYAREPYQEDYRQFIGVSSHPTFDAVVIIVKTPSSNQPQFITLAVKEDQSLTIADLEGVLGVFRRMPSNLYQAPQVAFFYRKDDTIVCTIFASYDPLSELNSQTRVTEVILRKE